MCSFIVVACWREHRRLTPFEGMLKILRMTLEPANRTALLLLDLQRDFLEANGRLPVTAEDADRVVASANRLSSHAEKSGWKLIFIKNEFRKADWIGNVFRKGAAIKGSAGAEIDPRVTVPSTASIVSKSSPDAFTNPELEEILKSESIRRLLVLGLMAEGCVRATVKSALDKGLIVTVVSDAVASTREFLKRYGLRSIRKSGAGFVECSILLRGSQAPDDRRI